MAETDVVIIDGGQAAPATAYFYDIRPYGVLRWDGVNPCERAVGEAIPC